MFVMRYYLVTFDRALGASYKNFHDDFVRHPGIQKWFHYIKNSYIIGTNSLTADEIADHFLKVAQKHNLPKNHLVVRVDLSERQGWLTEDAWNWIEKNQ
jgi:hypothetical protein